MENSSLQEVSNKIAFISGPLEPGSTYFDEHYITPINKAISHGHSFVLAASIGIDAIARNYLLSRVPPMRVTIFLAEREAARMRKRFKAFEQSGGRVVVAGRNHTQRDEAMTRASHYDILRYRTDDECRVLYGADYRKRVSGTEKNELRRKAGLGLVWSVPQVDGAIALVDTGV